MFFGMTQLASDDIRNDKKCIDDGKFRQKSILIVFRHNMSFKIENGQAYKKFLISRLELL